MTLKIEAKLILVENGSCRYCIFSGNHNECPVNEKGKLLCGSSGYYEIEDVSVIIEGENKS